MVDSHQKQEVQYFLREKERKVNLRRWLHGFKLHTKEDVHFCTWHHGVMERRQILHDPMWDYNAIMPHVHLKDY